MNHLFHINVFSQISPAPSSPIDGGDIVTIAPSEGGNPSINKIRTAVATGLLALSLSTGAQERPTGVTTADAQPVILAQTNTQETDGKIYTAEVIQIDGSKKTITYYRNARGAIIAPPVVDGKLIDGSKAPDNAVEARVAQKDILVKYDKGALLVLAMVGQKDLIKESFDSIKTVAALAEQGKVITKEQIQKSLLGQYILILSGQKVDQMLKATEIIAINQLKMSSTEFSQMKKDAESKAINIWKSTTGAMAIG